MSVIIVRSHLCISNVLYKYKLFISESRFKNSARPRDESPDSKKARKKAIKEEKAERRKAKTPKHIKKKRDKGHGKK